MKKLLSLILSLTMALTGFAGCITAKAATATSIPVDTVSVTFGVVADEKFYMEPKTLKVRADYSDKYADLIGYNDTVKGVSVLDALIAAHLENDKSKKELKDSILTISEQGWITNCFDMGSGLTYWKNNVCLSTLDTRIFDNDYLMFTFYSDLSGWSDVYVCADASVKYAAPDETVDFTFRAISFNGEAPAAGLDVIINGMKQGTTDKNGKFSYTVPSRNSHYDNIKVTAEGHIGNAPIFKPWCRIYTNHLYNYVEKELQNGSQYILKGYSSFGVADAVKLGSLALAGVDISAYKKDFVADVKKNLTENNGKLISPHNGKEDIGLYGAVILALRALGEDPSAFNGYDIEAAFEATNIEKAETHPYYYRFAIEVASPEKAIKIIEHYIDKYYTMGKGLYNGVYCCDNTSMFLIAISKYHNSFQDYYFDAKRVINSYTRKNGAINDKEGMVTEVNANSTALACAACAALGENDNAYKYYLWLIQGFESKQGIFTVNGKDDFYATSDAVVALGYMKRCILMWNMEHPSHIYTETIVPRTYEHEGKKTQICIFCGHKVVQKYPRLVRYGWEKIDGKWYYYQHNVLKKYWTVVGNNWYYMDSKGVMQTEWVKVKGKWYYLGKDGAMRTGWLKLKGIWYYLGKDGVMQTGWYKEKGKWYYFDANGAMKTGWVKVGGKWYYFGMDGMMIKEWRYIGDKWYFFEDSGVMRTGWLKDSGKWYYFGADGAMLRNTSRAIGAKSYSFNASGVCTNP